MALAEDPGEPDGAGVGGEALRRPSVTTDAFEVFRGRPKAPIVVTCEHASQALPPGWSWSDRDRRLVGTHWAFDPGAAELATALAEALDASAVLSTFSRLLVDPNRPEDSPTLFREHAEGEPIELNTILLDDAGRRARVERFLRPYHVAVDEEVGRSWAPIVLAMHTFTPIYEGAPRAVEVGVLFDTDAPLAERVIEALRRRGLRAEPNEPYSGKEGLMYAADRHARVHRRQAIELEVRQDLALDPAFRAELVGLLRELFSE